MYKQKAIRRYFSFHESPWLVGTISILLVLVVGVLNYVMGRDGSFTLLYLVPICAATWFMGRRAGAILCICAVLIGLAIDLIFGCFLGIAFWNAGLKFGVYLSFYTLLNHLKAHRVGLPILHRMSGLVAMSVISACVLGVAGWFLQQQLSWGASQTNATLTHAPESESIESLAELASLVKACMQSSRPVLLGSRNPKGPSCVTVVRSGDIRGAVPNHLGDVDGGPGTTVATLYFVGRQKCESPREDFLWHQNRLKTFLENEAVLNRSAMALADELAEKALRFSYAANAWTAWPEDMSAVGFRNNDDWPSYCMTELDKAAAAKDLAAGRHWAAELASAVFSLDDLHHWLDMLVENHLTALEFQRQCESLFSLPGEANEKYNPRVGFSKYPAGILGVNGQENYYEVERQAERLFSMPPDRLDEIELNKHLTPGSLWVMPGVRECFLKLEGALSPDNRKTWEIAARSPYEHSYLNNMLYRAWRVDAADYLCTVLRKFDKLNPHASVSELMGVLMYRGHSFAGLEWADRFQPELIEAADEIKRSKTDAEAFLQARRWTNEFYNSPENYAPTLTLRDALKQQKLDCIRATDMIGAIFRNAGRPRFGHVRWSSEIAGHSVAAYLGIEDGKLKTILADGLMPQDRLEVWPECYFRGHDWPPGQENNPPPYAVELYIRGIDSYIWAEGYIVRGPNAGWLTTAHIPYLPVHQTISRKIFDGPYPQ